MRSPCGYTEIDENMKLNAEMIKNCDLLEQKFRMRYPCNPNKLHENYSPDFNDFTEHLLRNSGKVIVIGSRPNMGKTSLMMSIIRENPEINHLILSLEYNVSMLMRKYQKLLAGGYETYEIEPAAHYRIDDRNQLYAIGKIFISENNRIDIDAIRTIIEWQQRYFPVRFVFLDYYQLIKSDESFLPKMKKLAQNLDFTIVLLSQLSKDVGEQPFNSPNFNDFTGLSDESFIDEYYYLLRFDYYRFELLTSQGLSGISCLYCVKGKFQNKNFLIKFEKVTGRFG